MLKGLFFLLLPYFLFGSPNHVVTYNRGGRFGDHLLSYLHAKWVSYQYQIPLRYQPFRYSSDLVLSEKEVRLSKDPDRHKRISISMENGPIDLQSPVPTMYICPYFPEDRWELEKCGYYHFAVDWKDRKFRKIAREMIAPKKKLNLVIPSKKSVNIAIHVREGGGFDSEQTRIEAPLKLPPMSFYVEGLLKILSYFPNQKVECYLFTDALNPKKIVRVLKDAVPHVKFHYRKSDNHHDENVLEDFFSLFHFDVLIRPQSNFSIVPSLIYDYAIVYSPREAIVVGDYVVIDQINLEVNEELYQKLLSKILF